VGAYVVHSSDNFLVDIRGRRESKVSREERVKEWDYAKKVETGS